MTPDDLTVRDPIDIEREQPETTRDLRALLADFGADHDDFVAGVQARLDGRELSLQAKRDRLTTSQERLIGECSRDCLASEVLEDAWRLTLKGH